MIALENLLNIIYTETSEYDDIHQTNRKHDVLQNCSTVREGARPCADERLVLRYDLELIEEPDGTIHWVE